MSSQALAERLTIATPCSMRWEDMKGDARVRHCGACRLSVHNLSEMTTPEVEALLQPGGSACVRLYRRPDGTVVTGDCRRIWSQQREEAVTLLGTAATVVAALSFIVAIAALTITLYGDHIRRIFGNSTTGALEATVPPSVGAPSSLGGGYRAP